MTLRIGTRRSPLALAQADEVSRRLSEHGVESEIVPMSTSGDEGAPSGEAPAGLKGLFVDTILDALERDEIDVAVHSAKDLPAEDDEGLIIAAVPPRLDAADVLVLREASLRTGAVIGTSSIRRRAQLLRAFPGVTVEDLRGNVDTRLRKVTDGVVDAAVLALAGLTRLGITAAPFGSSRDGRDGARTRTGRARAPGARGRSARHSPPWRRSITPRAGPRSRQSAR